VHTPAPLRVAFDGVAVGRSIFGSIRVGSGSSDPLDGGRGEGLPDDGDCWPP